MLLLLLLFAPADDAKLRQIVSAHDTAVSQVRSLDMQIEHYNLSMNGEPYSPPEHAQTWHWTKKGKIERQRFTNHSSEPTKDNLPTNLGDLIEDGKQVKALMNYDWDDPQEIHPYRQGTVRAWYAPQDRTVSGEFPSPSGQFAMFHVQATLTDPRRTLRELIQQSPKVELKGRTSVGGQECWHLQIEHPDTKTKGAFAGTRFEVYLDPSVNYMIRKVHFNIADTDPSPEKISPIQYSREAVKFHDAGDGVFVPTEVIAKMYTPAFGKAPVFESRFVVTSVSVNEELPADALAFRWPENALVVEHPPVSPTKRRVQLWGPDDKPVREVTSIADLGTPPALPAESGWFSPMRITFIVVSALAVATIVFFFLRRG